MNYAVPQYSFCQQNYTRNYYEFDIFLDLKNWIYAASKERSDVRFLLKLLLVCRLALLQTGQLIEAVAAVWILEK